jgi:hypothetical protein
MQSKTTSQAKKENPLVMVGRNPMLTGELRTALSNIMMAVVRGEVKGSDAALSIKAAENINVSLYSEIKYAALLATLGQTAPPLGQLRIGVEEKPPAE